MSEFDARAWLAWLLAGGILALLTSNPLYLAILLLISRLAQFACGPPASRGWRIPFWRVSFFILLFSTVFNMLAAHFGQTILFSLPETWPLIGGPITLEAAGYGFLNGLRLVTLLSFFMAFNAVVTVTGLTNLVPRALHELGLVVLIAITYVPETLQQSRRIRDAQAIRGHQLNGIRAWRPIIVPLLISSLERALNLAETMVSRGYGATASVSIPRRTRLLFAGGLLLVLAGALLSAWGRSSGIYWLLAGGAAVVWAYGTVSRDQTRTRYQARPWTWWDSLVVIGAALPLMMLVLPGFNRADWAYSPYPRLAWPPFNSLIGLSLLGLALPVLLSLNQKSIGARP